MERDEPKPSSSVGAKKDRKRTRSKGKSLDDTSWSTRQKSANPQQQQQQQQQQQHGDSGDGFSGFSDPRKTNTSKLARQNTAARTYQRKQPRRRTPNKMDEAQNDTTAASSGLSPERGVASASMGTQLATKQTLHWHTIHPHVPIQNEKSMLKTLLRWKENERGMIKSAGDRYKEIAKKCKRVMQLPQALSLRRQHIQHMNPDRRMPALGLGKDEDIRQSAAIFETSVGSYLKQRNIPFLTEKQQRKRHPKGQPTVATPDFMLLGPTLLSTTMPAQAGQQPETSEYVIHWVEAKMFYGASTVARSSKCAVGMLLVTAEKYCKLYGTGAMVFMYGCGKELAEWLLQFGVIALDAHPVDLRRVKKHQRTWCANENGLILP